MRHRFETVFADALWASRWLMAPLYVGLLGAILVVAFEFFRELAHALAGLAEFDSSSIILVVLKLIDLVLIGHLTFIVIFAGAETLRSVSAASPSTLPNWMGKVDFSSVKLKVVAAITAISAVDLLEDFINIEATDKRVVLWKVIILLAFVTAGLVLAVMDRLAGGIHSESGG